MPNFFSRFRRSNPDYKNYLIIGAGEVGFHLATRLAADKSRRVTVVDIDPDALARLSASLDLQVMQGSGCNPVVLSEAGVEKADLVLAVTSSDEDNLVACFFASQLAPSAIKIARLRNEDYNAFFETHSTGNFHINMLINPVVEMTRAVDNIISFPGALEYSEFADKRLKFIGVRMQGGPLVGRPLTNFSVIINEPNVRVAALVRDEKLIIPTGADTLEDGDIAYFACTEEAVPAVKRCTRPEAGFLGNILIIGGGNIGLQMAKTLENRLYHVKVLEKDKERCRFLAEQLDRAVVLHGDGTKQEVLREENAGAMDVIIAATGNEETNVLMCLLARSMGKPRTITRVNNSAYLPLARTLGIDHCVSPRLSTVNSIMKYLRRGRVLSAVPVQENEAEAIEMVVEEGAPVTKSTLAMLQLPKDISFLGILRGQEFFVPKGGTQVLAGDRLTVFARRDSLGALASFLLKPEA